jgi:hypothetical protein
MSEFEHTLNEVEGQVRISAVVLDQTINPTRSEELSDADPERLIEACGLIPDFFAVACSTVYPHRPMGADDAARLGLPHPPLRDEYGERVPPPIDAVASAMDAEYGCGGFRFPFTGTVDADGIYCADDDPPLAPLVRYSYPQAFGHGRSPLRRQYECFVYQYGITALREIRTGETRIARFD